MEKSDVVKVLEWFAQEDYRWVKKYPNGEVLWQKNCPDDSMDVWSLPIYTTEQLYEKYIEDGKG